MILRRRHRRIAEAESEEQLTARLIRDGFLKVDLTDKSRELLEKDSNSMDDYVYWCVHIDARRAAAIVHGTSITRAAIG